MNNYKMIIQYDGSRYNGWQKQNDTDNTIQQTINDAVNELLGENVKLIGSGRTDAGVHALAQCANFRCMALPDTDDFIEMINNRLPQDIRVTDFTKVDFHFHARHSCTGKRYVYIIDNGKVRNAFLRRYSWRVDEPLDIAAMKSAARAMTGEHDFSGFCTNAKLMPYTVKNVYDIDIRTGKSCIDAGKCDKSGIIEMEFYGSGFLYNMVRIMAGTLVDVGLGIYTAEDVKRMLEEGVRSSSGQLAPAKGLVLKEAEYDETLRNGE